MAEPKGRPKTLVRRLIIEVKEDTQEWLSEELDGLKKAFIIGKASRSVGEAVKGLIGHPAGLVALLTALGLGFLIITPVGRQALEAGSEATAAAVRAWWQVFLSPVLEAGGVTPEAEVQLKENVVRGAWDFLKGFLPFVPPGLP